MQVSTIGQLRLKPDDEVHVTFVKSVTDDDEIIGIQGKVISFNEESIVIHPQERIKTKLLGYNSYSNILTIDNWQIMSILCMEKDVTFIRRDRAYIELERMTSLLGRDIK